MIILKLLFKEDKKKLKTMIQQLEKRDQKVRPEMNLKKTKVMTNYLIRLK